MDNLKLFEISKYKIEKWLMDIFLNKKQWASFSPEEIENYIDVVFDYYKEKGFPYYSTEQSYRDDEFNKLNKYDKSGMVESGIIKQTMHGLALAWSYFPHSFAVRCNNQKSPVEAFTDDATFRKVIAKRIKIGDNISDAGIRKMLKMFTGVQAVSNFRPTAASAIYTHFGNKGTVWDMSGGYGGRLLGAITSDITKYICTEPCQQTFQGISAMSEHYKRDGLEVELHMLGSEDYLPKENSLDLCFTSPPYFDCEKYSDEDTQSYIKFPEKNMWINGFLKQTFSNCYHGLKADGRMIINIANVKSYKNIEEDTIAAASAVGFELDTVWKLALSNPNMRDKSAKFKYEPVYIFKKG
jgi:hypothetical protein